MLFKLLAVATTAFVSASDSRYHFDATKGGEDLQVLLVAPKHKHHHMSKAINTDFMGALNVMNLDANCNCNCGKTDCCCCCAGDNAADCDCS